MNWSCHVSGIYFCVSIRHETVYNLIQFILCRQKPDLDSGRKLHTVPFRIRVRKRRFRRSFCRRMPYGGMALSNVYFLICKYPSHFCLPFESGTAGSLTSESILLAKFATSCQLIQFFFLICLHLNINGWSGVWFLSLFSLWRNVPVCRGRSCLIRIAVDLKLKFILKITF